MPDMSVTIRPADNGFVVERNEFGPFDADRETKVAESLDGALELAGKMLKRKSKAKKGKPKGLAA